MGTENPDRRGQVRIRSHVIGDRPRHLGPVGTVYGPVEGILVGGDDLRVSVPGSVQRLPQRLYRGLAPRFVRHKFAGRTGTLDPSSVRYRSSWPSRHSRRPPAGYRGRMASHPARTPLGLFDNPVRVFNLDELAETVRKLERERPGRTVEELSGAVFTELAIKRTRRAADLVAEAIRLARPRQPGTEITGSQWQASTSEVRNWALSAGFELGADGTIPGPAITAYNQIHPGRPY